MRGLPLPSSSPQVLFLPVGEKQVVARSPTPAMPKKVSREAPIAAPRRVISARPLERSADFALLPAWRPSRIPAARAMMFLVAPANSTPRRSVLV